MSTDGDDFHLLDHAGRTAIFAVLGLEEVMTRYGYSTALRADVILAEDRGEVRRLPSVRITAQVPVSQLRAYVGEEVVAEIGHFETSAGIRRAKLVEVSSAGVKAAERVLETRS